MSRSISDPAFVAVAALAVVVGGCMLASPEYDGTEFSCAGASSSCPDGFQCVALVCVADDPARPDATIAVDDGPDAGITPGTDDASPPVPQTLSFGERDGADHAGVTFDTYLFVDEPLLQFGADDTINIDADPFKVGLLRFDISAIPAGATVTHADLTMYVDDPIEDGEYVAYPFIVSWDEDEANYVFREANVPWATAGAGAGAASPSRMGAFAPPVAGVDATMELSVQAVQQWVDAPQTNYGMRIDAESPAGRGGRFVSSESAQSDARPLLRVTFQ